ncbi:MAG: Npt1/Npt2 family nucleotide transporter [Kofleriaceae bacterium]|nr:Npt1/Npt2 family nucleotide transporter [Kofleriaceae bacterium]
MVRERSDSNPSVTRVVWLSTIVATFMIAQQIASKAVRDGFFLAQYDVTSLPYASFAGAVVSLIAALFFGKFIATFSPRAAVPVLFGANGVLFLVEAAVAGQAPRLVAATFYLHVAAFGGAVVSGFWSVINERFDPYTAKRFVGRIAGGATFGGVLGGALSWAFSNVEPSWLVSGLGLSSFACAVGISRIGRESRSGRALAPAPLLAGVSVIAKNSYPRAIALLVLLVAFTSDLVDYVFKAGVAGTAPKADLVGFFAVFYTVTGVATFLVQALGSRRVLKAIGVVSTVSLFPLAATALSSIALAAPGIVTLVLLRGGAMVFENSLYRSGYELLYAPVSPDQKRSAKVLVDLGCDRLGSAAASVVVVLLLAAGSLAVGRTLLLGAILGAICIGAVLIVLRAEYVSSLATQLKRAVMPERPESEEAAGARAMQLASTFVGDAQAWAMPTSADSPAQPGRSATRRTKSELLSAVRARADEKAQLMARDVAARARPPLSVVSERLLMTPLRQRLRDAEVIDAEVRQSAPALIGQLGDIVLSRRESIDVRMRAIELIASIPSRRGADAMVALFDSPELRIRRGAALALLEICRAAPTLRPARAVLTELAAKELERPAQAREPRSAFELRSPFFRDERSKEIAPSLELAFLLLAVGGDEQELLLALTAITSPDLARRGTGLEYLDNLLPGRLRQHLVVLAERPELTRAESSVPTEVIHALAEQLRTRAIDVAELRRRLQTARRARYDQTA